MKASIFAGLATGALASSIYPRQNSAGYLVINGTLTDIIGLVQALDAQVLDYTGGSDITPVTDAANAIVNKAEGSIPAVVATTNVTNDDEVLNIATLVGNPLEPAARSVVKDLEAKKDLIQANNLCETAFSNANNIYNATSDLGFAIAAKIDNPTYGYLAVPLINELLAIIAEAQVAFNPSNCTDAGTTTTTTTSTSTSTITTGTTTGTTTITTTATATNTITFGGYPSSSPSSKPYGNSTTYYSASSSFSYGASSQPVKSSTYAASSVSSYVASSSHAASSSYAASSGGSGGNGGSYPSSSAVHSSSYVAGPTTTGKVVYTGAAATIAPAGALVLAIAALLV